MDEPPATATADPDALALALANFGLLTDANGEPAAVRLAHARRVAVYARAECHRLARPRENFVVAFSDARQTLNRLFLPSFLA